MRWAVGAPLSGTTVQPAVLGWRAQYSCNVWPVPHARQLAVIAAQHTMGSVTATTRTAGAVLLRTLTESDVESDATVALARLLAAKLAAAALPKMSRTLTVMLPPLRVNSAEVAEG